MSKTFTSRQLRQNANDLADRFGGVAPLARTIGCDQSALSRFLLGHQSTNTRLLAALLDAKGMIVLSGYTNTLYGERLRKWRAVHREFGTTGNNRTETIWLNPSAAEALDASKRQLSLFDDAGFLQQSAG